ncbi:MAG: CNNM domain-containing protein, partial [Candidatus Poribacteria bacterium]|nr:CNNM domain-containing protein [Candidatus Poribacteria bacterium]
MFTTETLYLIFIFICFMLTAFFASSETGFFALQRVRLEHLVDTRAKGAQRVLRMIQHPEKFL